MREATQKAIQALPITARCWNGYRRGGKSGAALYDREEGIPTSEVMHR